MCAELDERHVRLDRRREHGEVRVPLQNNRVEGEKGGRGSGGAQQGPAFPLQLDNVTPIRKKKVELSSGKNKYNTTNHWQVRRRVKIDPKHSVQDGAAKTTATRPMRNKTPNMDAKHSRPVNQHRPLQSHKHRYDRGGARFACRASF